MLFRKTIAYLWILSVLVSNIGINLHTLYCFCKQKYEYSFFNNIHHHCEHDSKTATSHETEMLPPCCRKAMKCAKTNSTNEEKNKHTCCENTEDNPNNEERGCTKREFKYFKLDTDLNHVETENLAFAAMTWAFNDLPPTPFYFDNFFIFNHLYHLSGNKSPPPQYPLLSHKFGRGLLHFIQIYRC